MSSLLGALRGQRREGEGEAGNGGPGYALVDANQWGQLLTAVNTLSRNQSTLAGYYRELSRRVEELSRRIDELSQAVANAQSLALSASERLTATVVAQVLQVAASRALEGIASNITVSLEPVQRLLESKLGELEAAAAERSERSERLISALGERVAELTALTRSLADNLDKLARSQTTLADSMRRIAERVESAAARLAQAGEADVASRLDAVASDVKAVQAQLRALAEQVTSLTRAVGRLKEELVEELAGEDDEVEGARR